jgi:DNA modification methylase
METNIWHYAGVTSLRADRKEDLALRPTVKPTALVADAIRDVTRRGAIVLDPFAGNGTTIIAAEKNRAAWPGNRARSALLRRHCPAMAAIHREGRAA